MKNILKSRTCRVMLITAIAIPVIGLLRPRQAQGLYKEQFWSMKLSWHNNADIVIAGDSRTYMGVSPAQMNKTIKDLPILNYGFAANTYTTNYLDAVEKVLKDNSRHKTIVLGINPHSFLKSLEQTGGYRMFNRKSALNNMLDIHLPFIRHATSITSIDKIWRAIAPPPGEIITYSKFHPDGWNASNRIPRDNIGSLNHYRECFEKEKVDPGMIANVLNYTKQWSEKNTRVFGFRQPCSKEMMDLEDQLSGLDFQKFIHDFKAAGGIWLEFDQVGYEDFDHGHLTPKGARDFSDDLADMVNSM